MRKIWYIVLAAGMNLGLLTIGWFTWLFGDRENNVLAGIITIAILILIFAFFGNRSLLKSYRRKSVKK